MTQNYASKVAMAIVLAATLMLAMFVKHYKAGIGKLTLDRTVELADGAVTMDIGQDWQPIAQNELPSHALAGWTVGGDDSTPAFEVYVGIGKNLALLPKEAAFDRIAEYVSDIDPAVDHFDFKVDTSDDLARVSVTLIRPQIGSISSSSIAVEVIFLSNGSIADVAVATRGGPVGRARKWAAAIAAETHFKAENTPQETVNVWPWQFTLDGPAFIIEDQTTGVVTLMPIGVGEDDYWVGRAKSMTLPEYRDPVDVIRDRFRTLRSLGERIQVRVLNETGSAGVKVYAASGLRFGRFEQVYLLIDEDRSALMLSIVSAGTDGRQFDKIVTDAVRTHGLIYLKPLDVSDMFKDANVETLTQATAGWYEIHHRGEIIGFQAVVYDTRVSDDTVKGFGYIYDRFGSSADKEQSQWTFATDMSQGGTFSRINSQFLKGRHLVQRDVAKRVAFDDTTVKNILVIGRQESQFSSDRPDEFLSDGADLLLMSLIATSVRVQEDLIEGGFVTMPTSLSAGIECVMLKTLPPTEQDDVRILTLADHEFTGYIHHYRSDGVWLETEIGPNVKVVRSSGKTIKARFPIRYSKAVTYLYNAVGGKVR